jgi:hypothetical protein
MIILNPFFRICILFFFYFGFSSTGFCQSKNLAPNFFGLKSQSSVLLMPIDIELSEISLGGVMEPKTDWTEAASKLISANVTSRQSVFKVKFIDLVDDGQNDEVNDINALHAAISQSIGLHHFGVSGNALPTKLGNLDWSLGEVVQGLRGKTNADYALFFWVRDTYSSSERKMATVALALLGRSLQGGLQVAYSSLVDLKTGQIVWFNLIKKPDGDLRNPGGVSITLDNLLSNFPIAQ